MIINIIGTAKIDRDILPCNGTIEVLSKSERVAYATWKILDSSNHLLASVSRNYFIGDKKYSDQDILTKITEDILSYRVGRNRIFTDIKIQ